MSVAKEEEKHLLRNTIKKERSQVFDMVRRLGSKLSGLMFACGVLVLGFSVFILLEPPDPVLSTRLMLLFIGALGFVGGLNILCGMLLLLGED